MSSPREQEVFHNRYQMFADADRTKAWRIDITSHGDLIVIKVNGQRKIAPDAAWKRLIRADIEMQAAAAEFMIAADKEE